MIQPRHRRALVGLALFGLALVGLAASLLATPALAAKAPPPSALSRDDQATVQKALAYLQGVTTAQGHFTQTDPRGNAASGIFYLQRPGKARLDYDPPSGVTIASNGHVLTEVNRRLKTIQSAPLGFTPFALFLSNNIRLEKGVTITAVTHTAQGFSLTARRGRRTTSGQITFSFSTEPMALKGWSLTEPQGGTTVVRLTDFARAAPHPTAFFEPVLPPAAPAAEN